jgi:hypothetical protein
MQKMEKVAQSRASPGLKVQIPPRGKKTHCQLCNGGFCKGCVCLYESISVHVHKRKGCMHVNQMCNELLENGYVHA